MKLSRTTIMKNYLLIALGFAATSSWAQNKKQQDIDAIKSMCGCYEITFDYAETFSSDSTYEFKDNYTAKAPAEWVFVADESENEIVLQHILVMNDTTIIKHWRQDWEYQPNDLYAYASGMTWNHTPLQSGSSEGQWVQRVYQVDDSPRYEGVASWVHIDGRHFWESTVPSPLPRREYTKRSDYDVMDRTNLHELTDYGWVHEQDNAKVKLNGDKRTTLVEEKGYNRYYKIDDANCSAGVEWWEKHEPFWTVVRQEWDKVFDKDKDLHLAKKVDDKLLWKALFELDKELIEDKERFSADVASEKVSKLFDSYILDEAAETNATY